MKKTPAVLAILLSCAASAQAATPSYDTAALAATDRPATDTSRDEARHTLALLVFSQAKPGDRIIDLMPGTGYFTRLFSHVAGDHGHVLAVTPAELAQVMPKLPAAITALATQPSYGNVSAVVEPTAQTGTAALAQGGQVDVVWTSRNYHDMYGFFGAAQAEAADRAVFRALKPGGVFILTDHAASPGAGGSVTTKLHRIDPETVKAQVLAAGFVLDATTDVLSNPADPHTIPVFLPSIKDHTDQFAFRFRKPAK
jgi:predicted methyltransferase